MYASRVDYAMLPISQVDRINDVWAAPLAARRLQLIPDARPHDHIPLYLDTNLELCYTEEAIKKDAWRWNKDALMKAVSRGVGAREFGEKSGRRIVVG